MKKLLCLLLALVLALSVSTALAAPYQQHLANEATFDSLENARAKESDEMAALTGRAYMPDPALDTYPEGTTWVYRSAGIYTPLSAAPRMNTNFLVYVDKEFADDASNFMVRMAKQGIPLDVLFMDPPRKGSDQRFLDAVLKLKPKRIVYISCDPSSLARDCAYINRSYEIQKIQPFDMFPHTTHVETICLLTKK